MKFLDQVKIYIKAGNGGDGSPSLGEKNLLNTEDQTVVMVEKVDQLF